MHEQPVRNRTFRLFLSACLVAVLTSGSACNQGGTVDVSGDGPSNSGNGTGGKVAKSAAADGAGGGQTTPAPAVAIYFNTFQVQQGTLGRALGIGFLPADSDVTAAFQLTYPNCALSRILGGCLFAPTLNGYLYTAVSRSGTTLSDLEVSSLQETKVLTSQSPVVALATDPAGTFLATSDGTSTIQIKIGDSLSTHISIPGENVRTLQEVPLPSPSDTATGFGLFVLTDKSASLYDLLSGKPHLVVSFPTTQAAISPSGTQLVWVTPATASGPAQIHQWTRDEKSTADPFPAPDGTLTDLAVTDSNGILFRRDPSGASPELDRMDLSTGALGSIATLSIPNGTTAGITCPVEVGGKVYFADQDGGSFSIFRSTLTAGEAGAGPSTSAHNWASDRFATPNPGDDTAYVCPRVAPGGSS